MTLLKANFNGIQHIGIPVTDLACSKAFYARLGFEPVMEKSFIHNADTGHCCIMKRDHTLVELYLMPPAELAEIRVRGNGHIDHIAFDVTDVDQAYAEFKKAGFTMVEKSPVFLDFWQKGCRFFNVIGPDGERLEFTHVLTDDESDWLRS